MENQNLNVSVILPIKSASPLNFEELFNKCIESLKTQKVSPSELVIVHTNETILKEFLSKYDFGSLNVKMLEWTEEPNFVSQVNHGVTNSSSEWISIFEFDDEYSAIWFKNVKKYIESYSDVDAFLPIVVDIDEKGVFAGFTNEATFALNVSAEMGYLTNETLHQFQNFQTSGMVIKKSSYVNFGLMKPTFKLTFGYEFFLRMTNNSVKFMTIPRIGYKHQNLRPGSIFWNYKNGENPLTESEVKFWIEAAKKEYFFIQDRAIKYETQEV